jgi:predicted nucleotidyltransferase
MNRAQAIAGLKQRASVLQGMGATALYLFGSTGRDEAHSASDLDLFIDHASGQVFSLLDLVGIKQFLEEELGTEVDVVTRASLHPLLKTDIEQSALRIF